MSNHVVVVGASPKPERVSNLAVVRYQAAGWRVTPVHPAGHVVDGLTAVTDLSHVEGPVDVVTMYLNPQAAVALLPAISHLKPTYLWLNPGADGEPIASAARAAGLTVIEACNLVALSRGNPLAVAEEILAGTVDPH